MLEIKENIDDITKNDIEAFTNSVIAISKEEFIVHGRNIIILNLGQLAINCNAPNIKKAILNAIKILDDIDLE
jgi:hypothetical protein